ncbi:MAG: MOSC domain-containing protein [Gemmatimonadaceae bacterium]
MNAHQPPTPLVVSLNVGDIREVEFHGELVTTAIWKYPVTTRIALRGVNFAGDDQADRTVHGGPDKAVYSYSVEDYAFWRTELGIETPPGMFGENLTVEGLDLSAAMVGDQWRVGSTLLEVAQPRLPCFKLGIRMGDPRFPKRFQIAARMGAYLRVIEEGDVGAGDEILVVHRHDGGVTLREMVEALRDPAKARGLLRAPRLPRFWREVAERS